MSLTSTQKEQFSDFVKRCQEVNPTISVKSIESLCRLSKEYGKIGDRISNNPNINYDRLETQKDKIKTEVQEMLDSNLPGVTIHSYNLDPRGYAIKVNFPNGRTNSFGSEGWGIPQISFKKEVEKSR